MTIVPLATYMKMYRKRTGLSHDEVAYLLGAMCGTSVARHERAKRLPILLTALKYQFIFDACVCELYEGVFQHAQDRVRARARALARTLERQRPTPQRDHKLAVLKAIIGSDAYAAKRCHLDDAAA